MPSPRPRAAIGLLVLSPRALPDAPEYGEILEALLPAEERLEEADVRLSQ